ncbi:2-keto-4-pentenoate hydratase-like protein [Fulvimarina pelagi HTCC2506]|uniref:2-keto-4-pentenoate hydratase-like protein n=1 Tax=Fulvimarina pelagi HTCC2506 TaxID=314231 RepID=Q0FXK7_9HYPH|nr:fumarylacetoacetate hydrolase family protein [Fulvimarina pelagi]EAU39729.1 2-keto-4-pentenoate hydratase-like protein [Fulvimarina pelagi HTCC2506]
MTGTTEKKAALLAEKLIAARRSGERLARSEADMLGADFETADAHAVQSFVFEAFGPAGAFKTGRKVEAAPVLVAPIYSDVLRPTGSGFTASEVKSCGIELEIAFRLDRPLPDLNADDFAERARACVTALPVIEIVDGRIEDFPTLPDALKLADNQVNGGLVWSEPETEDARSFVEPVVKLSFNGQAVVSGPQKVPGGDAFQTFLAFTQTIGKHLGGFNPGQIVTTGTLTGLIFVEPGTVVEGHIEGLGSVSTTYR